MEALTKAMAAGRRRTVVLNTRNAFNLVYNPENFATTEALRRSKSSTLGSLITLEKR